MSDPLALVSELERRLRVEVGSLTGTDLLAAEDALDDASVLVRAAGNPAWTIDTVPAVVRRVVLGCARRVYDNPDGNASENFAGAYSYSKKLDEISTYLTEAEELIVAKAAADELATPRFTGSLPVPSAYAVLDTSATDPWWWAV